MEASELRSGVSLVYLNEQVCVVNSVNEHGSIRLTPYTENPKWKYESFSVNGGAVHPIPLTEDILLKCEEIEKYSTHANGTVEYQFKHKEPSKHVVVRVNTSVLSENLTFTLFNHSECDFTQLQFIKRIDFLHELQNGFQFLRNEELKIEL